MIDYKCKCCEKMTTAFDFDDVVALEKYCVKCFKLDAVGRKKIRNILFAKTHKFEKPDLSRKKPSKRKNKGFNKKKRKFTFVCNICGVDSRYDFKPYMCNIDGCKSMSFFRKEI